jgi:hypothetical protein
MHSKKLAAFPRQNALPPRLDGQGQAGREDAPVVTFSLRD